MAYTPLTEDQFNKAIQEGYTFDQIVQFEKQRKSESEAQAPSQGLLGKIGSGLGGIGKTAIDFFGNTTGLGTVAQYGGEQLYQGITGKKLSGNNITGGQALGGVGKLGLTAASFASGIGEGTLAAQVGKQALIGGGFGLTQGLEEGKTGFGELAKSTAIGGAVGAAIPLIGPALKGIGYVGKELAKGISSALSGVPRAAIEEAINNPTAVQAAIRAAAKDGLGSIEKLGQNITGALDDLYKARSTAYEQGLAQVPPADTVKLTTKGIKDVLTTTLKDFSATGERGVYDFSQTAINNADANKLQQLADRIYNWTDRSPLGINRLRQVIDAYKEGGLNLDPSAKRLNAIIGKLRTNLSEYVGERVPQIAQMNKEFAAASEVIDNMRAELKIGTADPNTALRKFLNVFNPKQQLYAPLVKQLGEKTGRDFMADIAGLAMSKWTPEGLAKYLSAALPGNEAIAALASGHPLGVLAIPPTMAASSPRIIGEAAAATGKIGEFLDQPNVQGVANTLKSGLKKAILPTIFRNQ